MAINRDKPDLWKKDIALSVYMYNEWFMNFAPEAFRSKRFQTTKEVELTLKITNNLTDICAEVLKMHVEVLSTLRMSTSPPLAVDRLIGLAGVSSNLVKRMEKEHQLPMRLTGDQLNAELGKIGTIIEKMADLDIFVWLGRSKAPTKTEIHRASTIVADRLCGSLANPIIRNAQEKRQLDAIASWLEARGYRYCSPGDGIKFDTMTTGTFSFHMNVPVKLENGVI